ncbi:zinc finger protein 26-like isoform X4 [Kryptolebias marmoratus]|uniref:zinc finger protein 26-like isoform X4 n=1 Tax=Kryptolebias marmoratus TaxID=37003 RepID=UPI0018ACC78A|nr:zinc finger protein 26-like isoform X4 [Kryptolebias marmoratus]
MNEVDHLYQNRTESLLLEKNVEMKTVGVHQQEDVGLNRTVLPADAQQMLVIKTEVPWSSGLDQQDPEPLHIKKEEEEVWINQEEEQLTEYSGVLFTPVKSEDDEEKPELFQLHQIKAEDSRETEPPTCSSAEQMKTETDGEDCGGPEPDWNHDPNGYLQSNSDEKTSDSSEFGHDDDDDDSGPVSNRGLKASGDPESEAGKDVRVEGRTQQKDPKRTERTQTAGKTFSCSFCSKTFKGCGSLINHIRGHTGEKPFECRICGKRFKLNCLLKYHFSIHTGEKPFKCGICGKKFKLKWLLKSHFRIHIEEKPFECEICGKKFRHMTGLKSHTKTHTGEKPFECRICGRKFARLAGLKGHIRSHRAGKTFECEYCDEKFNQETDFNEHMMDHKRKMPFCCSDCGKLFRLEFNFKKHLMGHRGEKSFDWDFFGENI